MYLLTMCWNYGIGGTHTQLFAHPSLTSQVFMRPFVPQLIDQVTLIIINYMLVTMKLKIAIQSLQCKSLSCAIIPSKSNPRFECTLKHYERHLHTSAAHITNGSYYTFLQRLAQL